MKGIYTALLTPFYQNELDLPAFKNLLQRQKEAKVDGVVLLSTTSEASTLTKKECITLLSTAKKEYDQDIIIGISQNSIENVLEKMKLYNEFEPIAYLICSPFYNKMTQNGLINFYETIAHFSKYPLILYNVPSRTGYDIPLECIEKLAKNKKIIGIKNASNSLSYSLQLDRFHSQEFKIFSGNDDNFIENIAMHHDGIISVLSNLIPSFLKDLYETSKKDFEKAKMKFNLLSPLFNFLSLEINPVPIKALMSYFKLMQNECRTPLSPLDFPYNKMISTLVERNKTLFYEYTSHW